MYFQFTSQAIGIVHDVKTIADNGKEFAEHETIAQWLNIDFFFSKPYHSWECGANENSNGLIRQYFPKVCSFENITNLQIQYIQHKMSNRSRKN